MSNDTNTRSEEELWELLQEEYDDECSDIVERFEELIEELYQ